MSVIPRNIFTYWHDPNPKNRPTLVKAAMRMYKKIHPDWNYRVLSIKDAEKMDGFPGDGLNKQALADWVRMCVVRDHGGFWVDATVLLSSPLDQNGAFDMDLDAVQGYRVPFPGKGCEGVMENWVFCAPKGNAFIARWCEEYSKALSMGREKYLKRYFSPVSTCSQLASSMPYLTMHGAFVVARAAMPDAAVSMKDSIGEGSPFDYLKTRFWDSNLASLKLVSTKAEGASQLVKVRGPERKALTALVESRVYLRDGLVERTLGLPPGRAAWELNMLVLAFVTAIVLLCTIIGAASFGIYAAVKAKK